MFIYSYVYLDFSQIYILHTYIRKKLLFLKHTFLTQNYLTVQWHNWPIRIRYLRELRNKFNICSWAFKLELAKTDLVLTSKEHTSHLSLPWTLFTNNKPAVLNPITFSEENKYINNFICKIPPLLSIPIWFHRQWPCPVDVISLYYDKLKPSCRPEI